MSESLQLALLCIVTQELEYMMFQNKKTKHLVPISDFKIMYRSIYVLCIYHLLTQTTAISVKTLGLWILS